LHYFCSLSELNRMIVQMENPSKTISKMMVMLPSVMSRKISRTILKDSCKDLISGMPTHHILILIALEESGAIETTKLGERVGISKSHMSAATDQLTSLGLINRELSSSDKRKSILSLTAEGLQMYKTIMEHISGCVESAIQDLDETEKHNLEAAFLTIEKFYHNVL